MNNLTKVIIAILFSLSTNTMYADEILNDDVKIEEKDEKQAVNWEWCGKGCRTKSTKRANSILKRLDNLVKKHENHENFYADTSELFKKRANLEAWRSAFKLREELGAPVRRIHESTQGTFKNLPNSDKDQRYIIVTFDSMFKDKKGIYTEQITLRRKNNKYKFIGYYFSKKTSYNY